MKIYLFRHGETDWNKNKDLKFCEETHDAPLNEIGREQARQNAKKLENKGIEHVYVSPLKRAYETGEILANHLGINLEVVDDLQEFSAYDETCIGFMRNEIRERIGIENFEKMINEKDALMDWRPLKCETKREARSRIVSAIEKICKSSKFDVVAIASHCTVLRELLRYYNFEDDSKLNNCEAIEAKYEDGKFTIIERLKNAC